MPCNPPIAMYDGSPGRACHGFGASTRGAARYFSPQMELILGKHTVSYHSRTRLLRLAGWAPCMDLPRIAPIIDEAGALRACCCRSLCGGSSR
jgi:hypothetical protein